MPMLHQSGSYTDLIRNFPFLASHQRAIVMGKTRFSARHRESRYRHQQARQIKDDRLVGSGISNGPVCHKFMRGLEVLQCSCHHPLLSGRPGIADTGGSHTTAYLAEVQSHRRCNEYMKFARTLGLKACVSGCIDQDGSYNKLQKVKGDSKQRRFQPHLVLLRPASLCQYRRWSLSRQGEQP